MTSLYDDMVAALVATSHFATVGKRADAAAALTGQDANVEALPAAYVIPADEDPSENTLATGGVSQKVRLTVDILIGVSNLTDATSNYSKDAVDGLETAKFKVRSALHGKYLGHADPNYLCNNPLLYAGGYKLGYDASQFWYVAQYSMDVYFRSIT